RTLSHQLPDLAFDLRVAFGVLVLVFQLLHRHLHFFHELLLLEDVVDDGDDGATHQNLLDDLDTDAADQHDGERHVAHDQLDQVGQRLRHALVHDDTDDRQLGDLFGELHERLGREDLLQAVDRVDLRQLGDHRLGREQELDLRHVGDDGHDEGKRQQRHQHFHETDGDPQHVEHGVAMLKVAVGNQIAPLVLGEIHQLAEHPAAHAHQHAGRGQQHSGRDDLLALEDLAL